jgi:hypothetical protein
LQRHVSLLLERELAATPPQAIARDQQLRLAVIHAVGDRVGREPAEDDSVRGTNPCAGEHRDHRLWDHAQVNRYSVALAHPDPQERGRRAVHLAVQLAVGQHPLVARLDLESERRLVGRHDRA